MVSHETTESDQPERTLSEAVLEKGVELESSNAELREDEVRRDKSSDQQDQDSMNSIEGIAGFYVRFVVRQQGRADLVWLYKTHKF